MPEGLRNATAEDRLFTIFAMQAELNDHVFRKNDVRSSDGDTLSMKTIGDEIAGN
jgi:hypothetical protein